MSTITLPGSIPGLIRPCSPVLYGGYRYVVLSTDGTYAWVARDGLGLTVQHVRLAEIELDLTDATGRAHAAWWLAGALGSPSPIGAHWISRGELGWRLTDHQLPDDLEPSRDVPELADLDPADDTRLPDGSRWVDAEALRRACMHVYGGAA